jgi:hypothetical protein
VPVGDKHVERNGCGARSFFARTLFFLIVIFAGSFGMAVRAQDIRIKVLDGRNGRPITNECVNVWVGKSTVASLLVPTNKDGIALLHLTDKDTETGVQNHGSACGSLGIIDPVVKYADTIGINSGYYVSCQAHPPDSPRLSFSVKKVLQFGDSSANVCGKIEASPKPGELVFFVRPRTWWERMKRRD